MKSALFFAISLCVSADVWAQAKVDDNVARQALGGKDGYQLRHKDERYEGLYNRNVSGEVVEVVSLTYGQIDYELKAKKSIVISSPEVKKYKEIGVTGCSFNLNRDYHLNMILKNGGDEKKVPLNEVINDNFIYPNNLGIYGYVGKPSDPDLFIPVYVKSETSTPKPGAVQLIIVSNQELSDVKWGYASIKNNVCAAYDSMHVVKKSRPIFERSKPITLDISSAPKDVPVCISVTTRRNAKSQWVTRNFKVLIPAK